MPFLWLFYAIVFLLLWAPAAWAAIACVNPTNGITDITNLQSTFTSGSITPNSGELALVAVGNRKSTAANAPALSGTNGWSVTWTQIASLNTGGSTLSKITLFRGVPSSGTAGTLSIDFSGVNQAQGIIIVILCSGVDQATNQGIVQSEIGSAASGTSHDVNLLAFGDAANGTALFGMSRGSPSAWIGRAHV